MRIPPLTITWISKWQRLQSVCYIVTNWINQVVCAYLVFVWIGLIWCLWFALRFAPFFFFFPRVSETKFSWNGYCSSTVAEIFYFSEHQWIPCTVHKTHKLHFSSTFSLKMGLTALFMHLKIILLQCFQFSISATISSIQTDPLVTLFVFFLKYVWVKKYVHVMLIKN